MYGRHRPQIRRRRRDGLDPRLLVVGDDRHRPVRFLRFGCGFFQDLDLAIDIQNLRHLLLEFGVATFQIVAHFVRLDFLLAEKLAHRTLHQMGETVMSRPRSVLARIAGQQSRRPHLMRIAMVLGLVARQRYQPSLGLRRDHRLLARSRAVVERRQCTIGHRPLDAALHRPMMGTKSLSHRKERRVLAVGKQHRGRDTRLAGSVLDRERTVNASISSSVIASSTACRHPAMVNLLVQSIANEESTNKRPVP